MGLHFHCEAESTAFTHTFRVHSYLAVVQFDELLHNRETQSYALVVHLSSSVQLSISGEDLREVLCLNSGARVNDVHDQ